MSKIETVDDYLDAHSEWAAVLVPLRELLRTSGLNETIKWGAPCYTLAGHNVVGLGAFKSYAGLWFFQGALLSDPDGALMNAQEGKTQAMRQWRFSRHDRPDPQQIRPYIMEAMENARAGRKVAPTQNDRLTLPAELQRALDREPELAEAFQALTPGRQREYAMHVGEAKREATRERRLEKCKPLILRGVGMGDRYRR